MPTRMKERYWHRVTIRVEIEIDLVFSTDVYYAEPDQSDVSISMYLNAVN